MEERNGAHHLLGAVIRLRQPRSHLYRICHQIAVGEHCRFGQTGGAAGVLKQGNIFREHLDGRRIGSVAFEQMLEQIHAGVARDIDPIRLLTLFGVHQEA